MTPDERRALAFLAALLFLSAAARIGTLPEPVAVPGGGFDLQAHIDATRAAVDEAERRERPLAAGETVDPNTAPEAELVRLPGVGPALARRILRERDSVGPFRTPAELTRVPGIGPATLARLVDHIALDPGAARRTARPPRGPAGGKGGEVAADDRADGPGQPVDLNRADAAALADLPGIGPVLAARIIAYRDSVGPFAAVDSLRAVKGIGARTLDRLRPLVVAWP